MPEALKRLRTVLLGLALCLALLSPLSSYPWFQTGHWEYVDGSFIAIVSAGAMMLLAGALHLFVDRDTTLHVPTSAKVFFALAGFGVVTAPWASMPYVAVFGTYQSGYGPLYHFILGVMIVAFTALRANARAMAGVGALSLLSLMALLASVAYMTLSGSKVLIPVFDYYGFIGFLLLFFPGQSMGDAPWQKVLVWAVRASGVLVVLSTTNLVLIALLGVGGVCALMIYGLKKRGVNAYDMVSAAPAWSKVAIVLLVALVPTLVQFFGLANDLAASMKMRSILMQLVASAMDHASTTEWLIGHGWGHMQGVFFDFLHWARIDLGSKEYDLLWRDGFHSHNYLTETVYSVGVIGLGLFVWAIASIVYAAPDDRKTLAIVFVCAYAVYSAVWFEIFMHLPFLALAIASFSKSEPLRSDIRQPSTVPWAKRPLMIGGSAVFALCLVFVSASFAQFFMSITPLKTKHQASGHLTIPIAELSEDPRGTDFVRAKLYGEIIGHIEANESLHNPQTLELVREIFSDIEARYATTSTVALVFAGLNLYDEISFDPKWEFARPAIEGKRQSWERMNARFLELSHYRSDVLGHLMMDLLIEKRYQDLYGYLRRILELKPTDPIGLYFLGAMQTQSPIPSVKKASLETLAKALNCGLPLVMKIPQETIDQIRANSASTACAPADGQLR